MVSSWKIFVNNRAVRTRRIDIGVMNLSITLSNISAESDFSVLGTVGIPVARTGELDIVGRLWLIQHAVATLATPSNDTDQNEHKKYEQAYQHTTGNNQV